MQIYQELSDGQKGLAKKGFLLFVALVNIFIVALTVSYVVSAWQTAKIIDGPELQISFQGEGKVTARPDVVKFTATVLTEKDLLVDAQKENTARFNAITAFLKKSGISEKDIKTTGYNVYPKYSYPKPCPVFGMCPEVDQTPRIIGYQIRSTLQVTVRDVDKAGDMLSGAVSAGANEVSGLEFTIDNPEALKAQARKLAIDDAVGKAKRLAVDLGKRLKEIKSFSESGGFPPTIYFRDEAFGKGGALPASSPDIQVGENEIVVNVNITYELD